MTSPHAWLLALGAAVVVSTGSTALACGALPAPVIRFAPEQPITRVERLARNDAIVLPLSCAVEDGTWNETVRAASCAQHYALNAQVTLRPSAGGDVVTGRIVTLPDALSFLPSAPLSASTEYRLVATFEPVTGQGTGQMFMTLLRTSDALVPAVTSQQVPSLVAEWYEAPVTQCGEVKLVGESAHEALQPQICPMFGAACRAAGTQRALRVRAEFGPLAGGSIARDYAVQLVLTSGPTTDTPFNTDAWGPIELPGAVGQTLNVAEMAVAPGHRATLALDLSAPEFPSNILCARSRAFDAAGQVVPGPELCATYPEWQANADLAAAPIPAPTDRDAATGGDPNVTGRSDAGTARGAPTKPTAAERDAASPPSGAEDVTQAGTPRPLETSDGCSIGATNRSLDALSLSFLALVTAWLRRRRTARL